MIEDRGDWGRARTPRLYEFDQSFTIDQKEKTLAVKKPANTGP